MYRKKLSSLLCILLITGNLISAVTPLTAYAATGNSLTKGSGKLPEIEIVRADEEQEERILTDSSDASYPQGTQKPDAEQMSTGHLASPDMEVGGSYEDDLSGLPYDPTQLEMTTINISTIDDLLKLEKDCRLDTWSRDKNIVLQNDIVLDGSSFKFIPIFSGIFDGQGHTISGLTVTGSDSYTGLFCITQESAVIKNLKVQGSLIPSGKPLATGGIVGDNFGCITGCSFEGNIEGYDYTGGIAGYNEQSGNISACKSSGYITGMHFTGGITGYNLGIINGCTNECRVNTKNVDQTISIKDVDISKYTNKLLNLFGDNNKQDSTNILNNPVDVGGICGYSQGMILSCVNDSLIGYEHVGYNVGGICGRQNGYINLCVNNGEVYGRKDVGGICGQAEPYVVIDLSDDMISQLTANMNSLHDLVNATLNDAGNESDIITARLNMVKAFTDRALNDTSYLSGETEDFINGLMDGGNELLNRIDYAMDEAGKSGGMIDKTKSSASNASQAVTDLSNALDDLDIYKYMTPEETVSYNRAKENIEQAIDDHQKIYDEKQSENHDHYYYRFINSHHKNAAYYGVSSNLVPLDSDGNEIAWPSSDNAEEYAKIARIVHKDTSVDPPEYIDFPSSQEPYADKDSELSSAAEAYASSLIEVDTETAFRGKYGVGYAEYLASNTAVMTRIVESHEQEMSEDVRREVEYAIEHTKQAINDLNAAVKAGSDIVSNLNSRSDIMLPKLSDEYKIRSNSLISNIQGMSDNLGALNNDVNSNNQKLIDDMIKVNDQFNIIMLLIADAIDGVLDQDYTDVYEDNSAQVAEDCTDATIADSINYGAIHGDINTSGIAGTMAIEYDFDLESDVTGIKDAATGTTYRTKCVLRRDKNDGYVEGMKSYVGGICGLQEMGTVLRCQNYGKLRSNSGDYVGGISGQSLGTIRNCRAKGILYGRSFIGGITGMGYDISGCCTLPTIHSLGSCHGAIAGDNDQKGRLKDNYFVSDDEAGIDRVSYSGKAEPLTYSELTAMEDIPAEFKTMRVSFVVDDKTISVEEYEYGASVNTLPLDLTDAEYIKWHWENAGLDDVRSDAELFGETARYITTLAGMQLRESGQSAVLVDGRFKEGDLLSARLSSSNDSDNMIETCDLTIPDDSQSEHLIRYCPPTGVEDVRIFLTGDSSHTRVDLTKMGRYYTFTATGNEVSFEVEDATVNPLIKYLKYEIPGVIGLIGLITGIIISKRHQKRSARKHSLNEDDIIDIDLDISDDITS
ncbi:MAG: hypothetical protein K6E63_04865 [Lachnospiraceae bacterium]|nr:hypothetical protein [Lachnospiraceae bacterium]